MPSINASTNSPAHQVRAQNPAAKGAEFGALVSQAAKAKHAAPPEPVVEPPTTDTTQSGVEEGAGGVFDVLV